MAGVVVVGSINVDMVASCERLPGAGETVAGDGFSTGLGGKGANQAVAARRFGAVTQMVGRVGADSFGRDAITQLHAEGIDTTFLAATDAAPTGVAHIRVGQTDGQNSIVVISGANATLTPAAVEQALRARAGSASTVVVQLEVPRETVEATIRAAAAHDMRVVLDPAPVVALDPSIWRSVAVVTPNEHEASVLTGIEVVDHDSAREAAAWFGARGVDTVAITLAHEGALVRHDDRYRIHRPFAVCAIDTTAAGDTFTGYLGAAIAEGRAVPRAIDWAMAAGALAVTQPGATGSIPERVAVRELMEHGSRRGPNGRGY